MSSQLMHLTQEQTMIGFEQGLDFRMAKSVRQKCSVDQTRVLHV